jgi:hypothetical protein
MDLIGNDSGLIALTIASAVHDRDPAAPRERGELVEGSRARWVSELHPIAFLELGPARGIVPKPLAEAGAWAEISGPRVEPEFGLRPAPRPDSIDEDPMPVVRRRIVVGAL